MGAAKNAVLVLGVLAYLTVAGGVLLQNLPLDRLLDDPPIVSLGLATGVLVFYVVVVSLLFRQESA